MDPVESSPNLKTKALVCGLFNEAFTTYDDDFRIIGDMEMD